MPRYLLPALLLVAACLPRASGGLPPIEPGELPRLLAKIKPQPGESPWREIPWLTSVTDARRPAIAEDKPLVIFTAADGSALSRKTATAGLRKPKAISSWLTAQEWRSLIPADLRSGARSKVSEADRIAKCRRGSKRR